MTQAYDRIIATITTASDATEVTKTMVKSTEWRAGTSGDWNATDCTLTASNVYQFRTPLSGMSSSSTAILPNIKAAVTVDWDTSATPITTVGDYFMVSYAYDCSSLTSLGVPDTSGLTSVGNYFMGYYACDCSNLTSLGVPDTSGLASVGDYFMRSYAHGCSNLTSLGVPDTSGLTSVGTNFMYYYAYGCSALTSLLLPSAAGWFTTNNVDWSVPSERLGYLIGYVPNATAQTAWQALTVSGKTLYTNYIQSSDYVLVEGGGSTEDDLTATNITSGIPTLGTPTLAQKHALVAIGIMGGLPVLGSPFALEVIRKPSPDRTTAIYYEDRTTAIYYEDRTTDIEFEDRTYSVRC